MFGVIGWSVVVPTLIGIFVGVWIDRNWPSQFSWTLMLMLGGLVMGCLNAWKWIQTESAINKSTKEDIRDDDQ
jgi:ATP synthase protein I